MKQIFFKKPTDIAHKKLKIFNNLVKKLNYRFLVNHMIKFGYHIDTVYNRSCFSRHEFKAID